MDTAEVIVSLAIVGACIGVLIMLCMRTIEPNTLAIFVFLGKRYNIILTEGLNIVFPFSSLMYYSLKPRDRMPFNVSLNVENDQIICKGVLGFQLLSPKDMREKMEERGLCYDPGYLLKYDEKQERIETDAQDRLLEMLDEQLSSIPAACALTKKLNDAIQTAVIKGLRYRNPRDKSGKTAEQKVIEIISDYQKFLNEEAKKIGVCETEIQIPKEKDLSEEDGNVHGLEQIFLQDYGAMLTISTLTLEPTAKTAEARGKRNEREIESEQERREAELVIAMIKEIKKDNPNLSDKDASDKAMIIKGYFEKPSIQSYDINIRGLENISPQTIEAVTKIVATKKVSTDTNKKGKKGGKK